MKKGYNKQNPGACITYHNKSKVPEHGIWRGMQQRCYNPKRVKYAIYGAKGIKMCDRWLEKEGKGFMNFLSDMGSRPSKDHSVERKDNDGDYTPDNCKWATRKEQCRNRTTTRYVEYKGERKSLAEWAEEVGIKYATLMARLKTGWGIDRMMTQKSRIFKKRS